MYTGEVTWRSGTAAAEVLEAYRQSKADSPESPGLPLPAGVAEILRRCFRDNPSDRWNNLAEVVAELQQIYRDTSGKPYRRDLPPMPKRRHGINHDRRTTTGLHWSDPRDWLRKAFEADGQDLGLMESRLPSRGSSRQAQTIADLTIYDEARQIYERLVVKGRKDLEPDLAALHVETGFVHESAGDIPGALALFDQAIARYERLVNRERRSDLRNGLASAYTGKAIAARALGDNVAAVYLCDQAIAIRERLVNGECRREFSDNLAIAYMNKALSLCALGDNREAQTLYDQTIAIRERLVNVEGRREFDNDLATAYMNKAVSLSTLREKFVSVMLYDQAIAIYKRLVNDEGRRELNNNLANAYRHKANSLSALGSNHEAVTLYDQAIVLYDRLVNREGRRELEDELADAYRNRSITLARGYLNKADAAFDPRDGREAVPLYDQAIAIYEHLVMGERRSDLAIELAGAYRKKAGAVDDRTAVTLLGQIIHLYERLVNDEGRRELAQDLAIAYMEKAWRVAQLGDQNVLIPLYDQAIAIYEELAYSEGRRELLGDLARAQLYRVDVAQALGVEQPDQRKVVLRAIAVLRSEIARTGRDDLQRVLDWAAMRFENLL